MVFDINGNLGVDEIVFDVLVSGMLNLILGLLELVDLVVVIGLGLGVFFIDVGGSFDIFVISNFLVNFELDLYFVGLIFFYVICVIFVFLYMVCFVVIIDDCIFFGNVELVIFMYGYNGDISVNVSNLELFGNGGYGILI